MGLFDIFKQKNQAAAKPVAKEPAATPHQRATPSKPYAKGTKLFEKYAIGDVIGKGGFGIVYSAEELETHSLVAIKVLHTSKGKESDDEFEAEIKIWLSLGTHPFIARLRHVLFHNGRLHAVMDYVAPNEEGETTLFDCIKGGSTVSDCHIGNWCIQFCRAMSFANSRGVRAHRDIKPMNILIGSDQVLKISDFGLAWAINKLDLQGVENVDPRHVQRIISQDGNLTCGTPGYIAPELFRGDSASAASDIFSFGITLWQMVACRIEMPYPVVFAGNNQQYQAELFKAQCAKNLRKLESLYWPVIERCLEPDPVRRYRDFEQLLADIKKVIHDQGLRVVDYIVAEKGTNYVPDLINQGASLSQLGRHVAALERLNVAIKIDPQNVAAYVNRGNVYSRTGEIHKAITDYNQALALDPSNPEALINRADAFVEINNYQRALQDLALLLAQRPYSLVGLCIQADAYGKMGQYLKAEESVKAALAQDGSSFRPKLQYGFLLSLQKQYDAAISWFDKAIALNSKTFRGHMGKAEALFLKRDRAAAAAQVDSIAHQFSDDPSAINKLAILLAANGVYEQAIALFKRLLQSSAAEKDVLLTNIGNAYKDAGQNERALKYFQAAIDHNPAYASAHLLKAHALYGLGDFPTSLKAYDAAAKYEPDNFNAFMGAGASLLAMQDYESAFGRLNKAKELDHDNPLVWYNLAVAALMSGRNDEALAGLGNATEIYPEYARAWYLKAQLQHKLGKNLDAWNSCVQAVTNSNELSAEETQEARKLLDNLTALPIQ